MIDQQWAFEHLPLVAMMLKGSPVSFVQRTGSVDGAMPFAIDPNTMENQPLFIRVGDRIVQNTNLAPNSVGVIPITGPCTKYNGDCGEPGMIQRTNWLMDLMRRENIGSIIQLMDTPGGESRAASGYVSVLQRRNKPVLSYADGMVASLGVWFSSASDEFYLSNEMDQVGSVGSYCTLLDFTAYLEKEGVKMLEIYAPQSTDKNGDYRAALAGDTSAIEADLKLHVDQFIKHVSNSRGATAAANVNAWNTGKMFYANESKKIGLSDGVMAFDKVVSKAAWLGKRNKN
jgi:ClpP class serine protease